MDQAELERVLAKIARDREETDKLIKEAGKLKVETWL